MKVSVLMSVYAKDHSRYLDQALQSIANQTHKNFELILVEDGPIGKDLSDVISKFRSLITLRSVRLINNQGLAKALNKGIEHCKSDFIARMDADDIMLSSRLEKQLRFFETHPETDILGTWAINIDQDGNEVMDRKTLTNHNDIKKYVWTCPMIHPSVMFKKESLLAVGGYNESLQRHQDYELWFRCAKANMKFANIPEPLIKYRFADAWNIKNDFKTMWSQVRVGWKGCRLVNAPLFAYLGVTLPLIKVVLPKRLIANQGRVFRKLDPRKV